MPTTTAIAPAEQRTREDPVYRKIAEPVLLWSNRGSNTEVNLGTVFVQFRSSDTQPRHRHVFEQIRYIMSGSMTYGRNGTARAGDCVYFPESVAYGPVTYEDGEFFLIQWPGPSEGGLFISVEDLDAATVEMRKSGGEFDLSKGGMFRHADGRMQDGYEAVAEFIVGKPLTYAPARYADQVLMRTSSFPESAIDDAAGVTIKHLGFFNEVGPNIKLLQFDAGATLPARVARSQQVWSVLSGDLTYEGASYPQRSLLHVAPGAERAAVTATTASKVLAIHLGNRTGEPPPFSEY